MNASILHHSTDTRRLQGWLEDWYAKNKYGTLIGAFVYFLASILAFVLGLVIVGYVVAAPFSGGRHSSGSPTGMLIAIGLALTFMVFGTVAQMLTHNQSKIKLRFNNTTLYYAGYRSVSEHPSTLIGEGTAGEGRWRSLSAFVETTEGRIATLPGWLLMKSFESLIHFKQALVVDVSEAAQVLAYMVVKDTRCFPPELEDEFPKLNVPRAIAFLLQFSGVSAFDAHTPGIVVGNDRREIWLPLID